MTNRKKQQSFTLIELLVVIVIIGILAGVIMISTSSSIDKASIAKSKVFEENVLNNLSANMVSRWKLDEINKPAANQTPDEWGNNTGTLTGINGLPVLQTNGCISNNCLLFDGTDDYVDFGNNSSLWIKTDDYTISLWAKFTNLNAVDYETMIRTGLIVTGAGGPGYWIFRNLGTNELALSFSDGSATRISGVLSSSNYLKPNIWYNVVVIFDRDLVAGAYINGIKTAQSVNISPQQGSVNHFENLKVGSYSSTSGRLRGLMDDVRLYNSKLSSSQIKQNYITGLDSLLKNNGISKEEYNEKIDSLAKK
ncbi:MAG TPA: prepilin-type N-terminal cleavage/methylation domain-containing protein [Candidatus Pacearchaeota archaeon]|nr:prepilin-type N-terminal cleavage/methylation domain-containing protein [Candidatus Pacearchaeota archaeon]